MIFNNFRLIILNFFCLVIFCVFSIDLKQKFCFETEVKILQILASKFQNKHFIHLCFRSFFIISQLYNFFSSPIVVFGYLHFLILMPTYTIPLTDVFFISIFASSSTIKSKINFIFQKTFILQHLQISKLFVCSINLKYFF